MTKRTSDTAVEDPPIHPIHTSEKIGIKRSLTPEGFLLCEEVPIARTGWMLYGPGETPVKTNDSGYAMIFRDESTLFRDVTIRSFLGKPVTNDHPENGQVSPSNWSSVAVGTAHNVRRGTQDTDVLLADLLITQDKAIADIQAGKVEVSAGYDADYETTGSGEGRQLNIQGNHIALVERGRCGPRCAIGDHFPTPQKGKPTMATAVSSGRKRRVITDAVRQSMLDAAAALATNDEDEGDATHLHIHMPAEGEPAVIPAEASAKDALEEADPMQARVEAIEAKLEAMPEAITKAVTDAISNWKPAADEAPPPDDDEEGDDDKKGDKTTDSAALETGFKALVADAEVLVPGMIVPAFDPKAKRKVTVDRMCAVRRKVIDTCYATTDGRTTVDAVAGKSIDTSTLDCKQVATLFRAAAGAKRLLNNRVSTGDAGRIPEQPEVKKPMTLADLNKINRAHFSAR